MSIFGNKKEVESLINSQNKSQARATLLILFERQRLREKDRDKYPELVKVLQLVYLCNKSKEMIYEIVDDYNVIIDESYHVIDWGDLKE